MNRSFILTNDKWNNKEKQSVWYEFQATYGSIYTIFCFKIHLNVALIQIVGIHSFPLPQKQLRKC